jgi:hypothetical protein
MPHYIIDDICLSAFSVAVTKYLRLNNLWRIEMYLAYSSGGWEVHKHATHICWAYGKGFVQHRNMLEGITWWDRASLLTQVSLLLLTKPLTPLWGPHPNDLPKALPPDTTTWIWRVSFQYMNFWWGHIQALAICNTGKTVISNTVINDYNHTWYNTIWLLD